MATTKEISVNVSKKLGRVGEFGSDMISASITMTVEPDDDVDIVYTGAWTTCWEEIEKQTKVLKEKQGAEKPPVKPLDPEWINEESPALAEQKTFGPLPDPSICPIHKVKMEYKNGKFGPFYSHSQKVGEKYQYCSGKGFK